MKGESNWANARARFFRNRAAVMSLIILSLIVLSCVFLPFFSPHSYEDTDWGAINLSPTVENWHFFGTDALGRDLFVRTFIGGRVSLLVGFVGTLSSATLALVYGAVSGFVGGKVDILMMRIVDLMYAIPYMLIAILLVTLLGREFYLVILVIICFSWMDMARVVRAQTLNIKSKEYIEAARALGVSKLGIVFKHIIPNLLGVVVIYVTVIVPGVMITESVLSFLGLGVQEPMTSWGVLIQNGTAEMETAPWLLLFPASFFILTLYCINYIGDGMRDALDPKDR